MKKIRIIQAVMATGLVLMLASCSSGYYPSGGTSASLIISSGPGIYASRYPDGRYYYRSPEGYMYWRGYDNRFYLDRSYLGRVHYQKREYNEWNRYNHNQGRRRYHR